MGAEVQYRFHKMPQRAVTKGLGNPVHAVHLTN